jgi:putative transcriptional regulator
MAHSASSYRPVGKKPLSLLLEALGEKGTAADGSVRIFAGGPVQPEVGFVVHTLDYRRKETMVVTDQFAVTSNREVLVDIGHARGPEKALVAFGYAGWGPGQLEGELARNDWFLVPADADLVFDVDREKVWDEAMARRSKEP